jgi:hypothetical protein
MRSLRASCILAAVVAAIPTASLWGQTPESTGFHPRQWGMDFNISGGFVGAGLIHFTSPTQAMVLNLNGSASTTTSIGGGGNGNSSQLNLSFGGRRYRSFAPRLYGYRTFGIEGAYQHSFFGGGVGTTMNAWMGGLFGELGAGWMVTPHLALGASWRLSADYVRTRQTAGATTTTANGFNLTLGQVQLKGQLYF